eukprot:g27354.t1
MSDVSTDSEHASAYWHGYLIWEQFCRETEKGGIAWSQGGGLLMETLSSCPSMRKGLVLAVNVPMTEHIAKIDSAFLQNKQAL